MKQLKSRYNYDPSHPLSKQYDDPEVFNAYYKCIDTQNNMQFLLSHFKTKTENKTQISSLFKKFAAIQSLTQQKINSKYLNQIHDVFLADNDKSLFLVSEYCEGGSIIDYLGKVFTLEPRAAARIVLGAVKGLQELHKHDILNCFLNLENIEIAQDGTPKLSFKCMIYKTYYLSPEFRKQHVKSKQSDIYCLGVCLYRMIFGAFPFKTNNTSELVQMVKMGPAFSVTKQKSIFPLVCPASIRDILRGLLSINPSERIKACETLSQKYTKSLIMNSELSKDVYSKIFKSKYINFYTKVDETDEHEYSILEPKEKKMLKLLIYKGEKKIIDEYLKNVISKFSKLSGESFVKIYEYQIVKDDYLALACSYCSEGTLAEYRKNIMGNFSIELSQKTSDFLIKSLKQLQTTYKYLTNENVCLKNGNLRIIFPSFNTHSFREVIKKASKIENHFIAPEILAGQTSQNCDSWSVGVIEYWMLYNEMPKIDSKGTLIPNNSQKLPKNKLPFFNNVIQKNPSNRLNLLNDDQVKRRLDQKSISNNQSPIKNSQTSKLQIKPTGLYGLGEDPTEELSPKKPEKIKKQKNKDMPIIESNNRSQVGILPNKIQFDEHVGKSRAHVANQKSPNRFNINVFDNQQEEKVGKDQQPGGKQQKKQERPSSIFERIKLQIVKVRSKFASLDGGYTRPIRLSVKCILAIIIYLFLFYFNFFTVSGSLLSSRKMYEAKLIPIRSTSTDSRPSVNYTLVTKTPDQTYQMFYNSTVKFVRNQSRCVLNDYAIKSNVSEVIKSDGFATYQMFGIFFAIINLLVICLVIMRFDLCRVCHLTNFDENKYHPLINYSIVVLAIFSLTSLHYLIYGGIYHLKLQPCLSFTNLPGLEYLLKSLPNSFIVRFIWAYLGIGLAYATIIFFLVKPLIQLHKYFYIAWICLYVMGIGIRGMGKGYPAYENVFGASGELLGLLASIFLFFTDLVFGCFVKREKPTNNQSNIDFKSIEDFNRTEEFFVDSQVVENKKNSK